MPRTTEREGEVTYEQLLEAARQAARHSYSPVSKYPVGCAILTESGAVFTGCNIENANLDLSVCAERSAAIKAVTEGDRRFKTIAVVTPVPESWPCGNCRQFLVEFGRQAVVIVPQADGKIKSLTLDELLPGLAKVKNG
jgi:cytidine deaminase